MQKKNGFSLLELLVVTGIVALLAAITVPGYVRMRSVSSFNEEANMIFDHILEVRMNALTGKMCDNLSSQKWIFSLNSNLSSVTCENSVGLVTVSSQDIIWRDSQTIELDDVANISTTIEFLPETAQALIPDGANQYTNAKILLTHATGRQLTICFNRIAGIPQLSQGDIDCTP